MDHVNAMPTPALKHFCEAAVPLVAEIVAGLSEPARAALNEAFRDGSIIATSLRIDVDLASQVPTVVCELIDRNGGRHHVQTRNVVVPPPRDAF